MHSNKFGNYICYIFAISNGRVAERLGSGLQNHLQRFKSARDLKKPPCKKRGLFSFFYLNTIILVTKASISAKTSVEELNTRYTPPATACP